MEFNQFLEKRGKAFWGIVGVGAVILLGIIDFTTVYEMSFSFFYLLPVGVAAWYGGHRMGMIVSAASAVSWFLDDFVNGTTVSPVMHIWNISMRVTIFVIMTTLLTALHKSLRTNQELARADFVTGAVSIRYFYELANAEINRSHRYKHPLTLAYIDLDNFKQVNDRLGHSTGDRVLRTVTEIIQRQIRHDDILARLGGDEFALMLPETGEEEAKKALSRINLGLAKEMLGNGWMVTFSVGAVTFYRMPKSVDAMLNLADKAMYKVKTNGKNGVDFLVIR